MPRLPFRSLSVASSSRSSRTSELYALLPDEWMLDPRLVVVHEPHGFQAEQYRSFRTNLLAQHPGEASTSLLFASAYPDDGKSVTAANVALCLAEHTGERVCLIDADVRSPSQGELFGLDAEPGLTDVLMDRLAPERALRRTEDGRLAVMTAGRYTDDPHDVVTSDHIASLLGHLKQEFRYILLDTPPCLAYADAADLSMHVDGVVFVVKVGQTPKREADVALARLQAVGATVLGTFVTGGQTIEPRRVYVGL